MLHLFYIAVALIFPLLSTAILYFVPFGLFKVCFALFQRYINLLAVCKAYICAYFYGRCCASYNHCLPPIKRRTVLVRPPSLFPKVFFYHLPYFWRYFAFVFSTVHICCKVFSPRLTTFRYSYILRSSCISRHFD